MSDEINNNEGDADELWNIHVQQWRNRLKDSASKLCQLSNQLQEAFTDERRFAILTDISPSDGRNREIFEEITEFNRLLKEALTTLVDLWAYDNPEREYPDLTKWFEFSCPNVFLGVGKVVYRIEDGKVTSTIYKKPDT